MTATTPFETSPFGWFVLVCKRYAQFEGRARRKEFWYFVLFYTLFFLALSIIEDAFGWSGPKQDDGPLTDLFMLGMLLPQLGVCARRLHDRGASGWWLLLTLVPGINVLFFIAFTVFAMIDGTAGANRYGPDPKAPVQPPMPPPVGPAPL